MSQRGGKRPGGPGKGSGGGAPKGGAGKGKGRRKPPPTKRSSTPGRAPTPRGRGRTGTVGASHAAKKDRSGLGGEQVEGIHAVRELLLTGRRRVHEIIVATERDDSSELDDIRTLAGQQGLKLVDLERQVPMPSTWSRDDFVDHIHLTPRSHALAARAIMADLEANGVLPSGVLP